MRNRGSRGTNWRADDILMSRRARNAEHVRFPGLVPLTFHERNRKCKIFHFFIVSNCGNCVESWRMHRCIFAQTGDWREGGETVEWKASLCIFIVPFAKFSSPPRHIRRRFLDFDKRALSESDLFRPKISNRARSWIGYFREVSEIKRMAPQTLPIRPNSNFQLSVGQLQ